MSVHPIFTECVYCGELASTQDHVLPRSRGGTVTVPCCGPCNSSKRNRTPEEWIALLLEKPRERTYQVVRRLSFLISAGVVNRYEMSSEIACLVNHHETSADWLRQLSSENDLDIDAWERREHLLNMEVAE